jgi:O-antigen/teichoic acid export membrane protein
MLNKITKQNIFLIDAIGAFISTLFLALILPQFKSLIGVGEKTLLYLAIGAILLTIYSFLCFKFKKINNALYLKLIMIFNSLYVLITLYLVFINSKEITVLGQIYFGIEILIICILLVIELFIYKDLKFINDRYRK